MSAQTSNEGYLVAFVAAMVAMAVIGYVLGTVML